METGYCKSCNQDRPLTDFCHDGLKYKAQCRQCRGATEKIRNDHKRAVKNALERGEAPPPPPVLPEKPRGPVGHLNDTKCTQCGITLKRQRVWQHTQHMHPEQPHACPYCEFTSDCHGFMVHHIIMSHAEQATEEEMAMPRPLHLSTCTPHLVAIKRFKQARAKRLHDANKLREQQRERRANQSVETRLQARATGQRADEKRAGKRKCDTSKYEGTPLRKYQKRFQEKSLATRAMRMRWRANNYSRVRDSWRRCHVAHREKRLAYSRAYRVKNKVLRLQQIHYGAQLRGLAFSLDPAVAYEMMDRPCHYCDCAPDETTKCGLHGFDRVDNSRGYVPDNVVPCCPGCNYMKAALSVQAFLGHVHQIYDHMRLGTPDDAPREGDATALEDTVLAWGGGVQQSVLTNVEALRQACSGSQADPLLLFDHTSRRLYKEKLQWMRGAVGELAQMADPAEGLIGAVIAADNADDILRDMHDDAEVILQEFGRVSKKRYMVQWANKAEWRLTDEEAVALMYKNECTYCGFVGNLGFDRLNPKGDYHIDNVVPACASCNIMRGAVPVVAFLDAVKRVAEHCPRDVVARMSNPRESGPQRQMRVTTTAMMVEGQVRTMLRMHTRRCGRGHEGKWWVVDVAAVRQRYPDVAMCKVCVTTREGAVDCKDRLAGETTLTDYTRLVRGIAALRADQFVVTDTVRTYHTQMHKHVVTPHVVVPTELLLAHLPHLRPCSTCVSTREGDAVFDGVCDLPRVETAQELQQAVEHARECQRKLHNERRRAE